jgi:hypothetical protein
VKERAHYSDIEYLDEQVRTEQVDQTTAESIESTESMDTLSKNIETDSPLTIQLFAERLIASCKSQKVGEIVIRKEIDTRIIEVPVQQERLIIEQVSPSYQKIAELTPQTMGAEQDPPVYPLEEPKSTFSGQFSSCEAASQFLSAIAELMHYDCEQVQISIQLKDGQLKDTYQYWLQHYS